MNNDVVKHADVKNELVAEHVGMPTPLEVQLDSQKAIARIGAVTQVIDGCAKASIQRTGVSDWVRMGKGYYLQASGAQKIRPIWGIYYRDKKVTKEVNPNGSYGYLVEGVVGSKVLDQLYGEVTIEIDGGRSSDDPFFTKNNRVVDPLDVRKAALANWEARAVTALLGLKNLDGEDLRKNGINLDQVQSVEYHRGAEGGGNTTVISQAQMNRLFAIAKSTGVSVEEIKHLSAAYGFVSPAAITKDRYEEIVAVVQVGAANVANKIPALIAGS